MLEASVEGVATQENTRPDGSLDRKPTVKLVVGSETLDELRQTALNRQKTHGREDEPCEDDRYELHSRGPDVSGVDQTYRGTVSAQRAQPVARVAATHQYVGWARTHYDCDREDDRRDGDHCDESVGANGHLSPS